MLFLSFLKMIRACLLFAILPLSTLVLIEVQAQNCQVIPSSSTAGRTVNLTINSKRNQSGEWVTNFSAKKDLTLSSNNITLDVMHKVIECNGKQTLHILGLIKENSDTFEQILFHPRCGKNVAIVKQGLTLQKLNPEEPFDSVSFTNRPLKDNELFEVRIDKKNNKFGYSLGIGVTAHSPYDVDIPKEMYYMPKAWMMHHNKVYENRKQVFPGYSVDINHLKVGDKVGVMRSNFGTLNFFVNGKDLGPAVSNIPSTVYGVFELWQDALEATIVSS